MPAWLWFALLAPPVLAAASVFVRGRRRDPHEWDDDEESQPEQTLLGMIVGWWGW